MKILLFIHKTNLEIFLSQKDIKIIKLLKTLNSIAQHQI